MRIRTSACAIILAVNFLRLRKILSFCDVLAFWRRIRNYFPRKLLEIN